MIKMYTKNRKWIVVDGDREIVFDDPRDAWEYVFLMRSVRPNVPKVPKALYPVKTLNPFSSRKQKKIIYTLD